MNKIIPFDQPKATCQVYTIRLSEQDRKMAKSQNKVVFPSNIKSFVERSNMPKDTLNKVKLVIQHIEEFLKSQNEEYKITPELFIDQEDESEEIKIKIEIKKDLEYIYDHLRAPIYNIIIKILPKKIRRKILINLEPL
jgi:hypothetical protein